MKKKLGKFPKLGDQFIVDKTGKKKAIILTMEALDDLIEQIEEYYDGLLAEEALKDMKNSISHEEVVRLLVD